MFDALTLQTEAVAGWTALLPAIILGLTGLALLAVDTIGDENTSSGLLAAVSAGGSLLALGVAAWFLVAGTDVRAGDERRRDEVGEADEQPADE